MAGAIHKQRPKGNCGILIVRCAAKENGRFVKGRSANRTGRPLGSRNKVREFAQLLVHSREVHPRSIELALNGDRPVLGMCFDRILAPPRDRRVR